MRSKLGTPRAQADKRLDDQREPVGQVVAGAAVEPDAVALLPRDHAEAVVFDLVQPLRPRWAAVAPWSMAGRSRRQGIALPIES
jgi:hypothetical protein